MKYPYLRACCAISIVAIFLFGSVPVQNGFHSEAATPKSPRQKFHSLESPESLFMIRADALGDATCHEATVEEGKLFTSSKERDVHVISPSIRPQGINGLTITLRGTTQLEEHPDAKAAFLRAAANWEAVIKSPISVVIDVDFGPKRFDEGNFPAGVLGSTRTQLIGAEDIYSEIRGVLIETASSESERNFYNTLPATELPTDKGATKDVVGAAAIFRAMGVIDANADPDAEEEDLGDPPSIGFNSAFTFDFDSSNGVNPNDIDFDTVATHEIGHALGFTTMSAQTQPSGTLDANVWDFFRFVPGAALCNFTTAQRRLTGGGEHVFYAGCSELALSTGTAAQGGDDNQTSHCKADELTGITVGIMDPTIARGRHFTINNNDLAVLDAIGHSTVDHTTPCTNPGGTAANIRKVTPDLTVVSVVLKGEKFSNCMQVEINGVIVSPKKLKIKGEGAKAVITGGTTMSSLNLTPGQNQVRVKIGGTFSNMITFGI
jgi:hypothetical protein